MTSLLKTAEELKIKGLADVSGKSIPKDDDEDSVTYGPSSLTLQSRDDDRSNDMKADPMGDYDDMFTPTIVDGAPSINVRRPIRMQLRIFFVFFLLGNG